MENQFKEPTNENPTVTDTFQKPNINLPVVALALDIIPVFLIFSGLTTLFPLIILLPIIGMIIGVAALNRGKAKIGTLGKVLAIIAISLPLSVVAFIVIFFIGAATGLISLM